MRNIFTLLEELNIRKNRSTKKKNVKNKGFENLKNNELKYEFENCIKVKYNSRKHIKLSTLGFKTIYQLDNLGKRRWSDYFNSGGRVYLISYSTKLPIYKRIIFDRKIKKFIGKDIPLPLKPKPIKRIYVKGGKNGKVLGFNYYMISDQKLLPKHRKSLVILSEDYISQIIDEKIKLNPHCYIDISELDIDASDSELVEEWNLYFEKYGYRFPEFEKQWLKLYFKDDFGINIVDESICSETDSQTIKFNIKDLFKTITSNLG